MRIKRIVLLIAALGVLSLPAGAQDYYVRSLNKVMKCDQFSGSTADVRLTACYNALPSGGGVMDARGISGAQSIAATVTLAKSVMLILSPIATYTEAASANIKINSNNVVITGGASIVHPAGQSAITTGTNSAASFSHLKILNLRFTGPTVTTVGNNIDNAIYLESTSTQDDVEIAGNYFTANAHDPIWIRNATNVRIHDNEATSSAELVRLNGVTNGSVSHNTYTSTNIADSSSTVVIQLESVAENYGGGTYATCSDVAITGNVISGMSISSQAILVHSGTRVSITGNTISSAYQGIAISQFGSTDVANYNTVSGNTVSLRSSAVGASGVNSGVIVTGYDATHLAKGNSITGNTVYNANTAADNASYGAYYFSWTDGLELAGNAAVTPTAIGFAFTNDNKRIHFSSGSVTDVVASSVGSIQTGLRIEGTGTNTGHIENLKVDSAYSLMRVDPSSPGVVLGRSYGTNLSGAPSQYVESPSNFTIATAPYPISAFCTGVASASSTLYLFGGGGNATTCTATAATSVMPVTSAGYVNRLYATSSAAGVNASSGVVTVTKNGSVQSLTCTFGTTTACSDTTLGHGFVVAAGDYIQVKFTTQGGETLANVGVRLEQQVW